MIRCIDFDKTVKTYRNEIVSLPRWFGAAPHRLTREDVREYLLEWYETQPPFESSHGSACDAASRSHCGNQKASDASFSAACFATHSYEDGCDICRIQKRLGHMRLETTTIYVKVAKPTDHLAAPSPLDKLYHIPPRDSAPKRRRCDVGQLRIHFIEQPSEANCRCAKVTVSVAKGEHPIYFTGIMAKEVRPGDVTLDIPPLEEWAEPLSWLSRVKLVT